ncbi:MAG: zinc-binding dehydrogenase [Anaerolineae bacterium]|nr:zinc-binding dehydrogenase [Anaerolineae bacterium]
MKGLMFIKPGQAELTNDPMPAVMPDTMLVRTLYSGLSNGTERSFLVGGNYGAGQPWPKRLAYQHVSRVVECGSQISRYQVGDVVFSSTFPGHVAYHVLRESDLVVRLPEGMDPISATMLGVASVSFHDARRARITVSDRVLVLGDGLIGIFASQAARAMGAHVVLAGHHIDRLRVAHACGTDVVIDNSTNAGDEEVIQNGPYTAIFECSGGDVMDWIIGVPGKPGLIGRRSHVRLVMVAGRYDVSYNFNMAGNAEVDIIHTQHFDQSDLENVVRLVTRGTIALKPVIRDVVPIDEAVDIFDTLRDNPRKLPGTVFSFPED